MRLLDGITNLMDMSLGVGDGQGGLGCCSPWGPKELNTTEQLSNTYSAYGSPGGSVVKNLPTKAEGCRSSPWVGKIPRRGK